MCGRLRSLPILHLLGRVGSIVPARGSSGDQAAVEIDAHGLGGASSGVAKAAAAGRA
jgi:hypothetical protein